MSFDTSGDRPQSGSQPTASTSPQGAVSSQTVQPVTLALAAVLSRKGELRQAENLLIPLADDPDAQPSTLDLLAKIYAQQGNIDDAQALWLRALQKEPSNTHFLAALQTCADVQRLRSGRFRGSGMRWLVIGFNIALITALAAIIALGMLGKLG